MHKNTTTLGIIPARFASTRFPGKPLTMIAGKTMISRVYEQVHQANLDAVVVATDDERIRRHVEDFGGRAVMTSAAHASGTDRCAEVASLPAFSGFEIVVNIQGDEPFIRPSQIVQVADVLLKDESLPIATLAKKIEVPDVIFDPHTVKVVFDKNYRALYFSRSPLPFVRDSDKAEWPSVAPFFKHLGLYAFRRKTLLAVSALPPGLLERAESLEQLRWLENGFPIGIALTEYDSKGIDTPEDIVGF